MDSKLSSVKHKIENSIAEITFYHPKGNSFPSEQLRSLEKQIEELGKNDKVKVIVITSEGEEIFSSGAYFNELLELNSKDKAKKFFLGFVNVILAMRNCPKFIIAGVEGKVVGGGVGLIAACDYAIARQNASIRLSELSIGFGPFVIEPALRRKMGLNAVSELALNPKEWKDAKWAKKKGLYDDVYTGREGTNEAILNFATQLSSYSLEAMADMKKVFWEGTEDWKSLMNKRAEMSGHLVLTEEAQSIIKKITQNI